MLTKNAAAGTVVVRVAGTAEAAAVARNYLATAAVATVVPTGTACRRPFPLPTLHHAHVSSGASPPGLSPPLVPATEYGV